MYLVHDPAEVPGVATLGPDPLAADFTLDTLASLLAGRRTQIKGVLRDQQIIAGIGNAYSDEVLHAAKMSPVMIAASMTADEVATLYDAIETMLTEAVERSAGLAAEDLKARRKAACGCTAGPASPARCAATRSGRFRSPTPAAVRRDLPDGRQAAGRPRLSGLLKKQAALSLRLVLARDARSNQYAPGTLSRQPGP